MLNLILLNEKYIWETVSFSTDAHTAPAPVQDITHKHPLSSNLLLALHEPIDESIGSH